MEILDVESTTRCRAVCLQERAKPSSGGSGDPGSEKPPGTAEVRETRPRQPHGAAEQRLAGRRRRTPAAETQTTVRLRARRSDGEWSTRCGRSETSDGKAARFVTVRTDQSCRSGKTEEHGSSRRRGAGENPASDGKQSGSVVDHGRLRCDGAEATKPATLTTDASRVG